MQNEYLVGGGNHALEVQKLRQNGFENDCNVSVEFCQGKMIILKD